MSIIWSKRNDSALQPRPQPQPQPCSDLQHLFSLRLPLFRHIAVGVDDCSCRPRHVSVLMPGYLPLSSTSIPVFLDDDWHALEGQQHDWLCEVGCVDGHGLEPIMTVLLEDPLRSRRSQTRLRSLSVAQAGLGVSRFWLDCLAGKLRQVRASYKRSRDKLPVADVFPVDWLFVAQRCTCGCGK